MRKFLIITFLMLAFISETFAYAIKVYDEYGNRVGTYRKEGERFQLYDFNDNKVEEPSDIIKDAPTQRTLKEYTRTLYDENMMPIGTMRSGLYSSDGRYYPRGYIRPAGFYPYYNRNYIVRPGTGNLQRYRNGFPTRPNSTNIIRPGTTSSFKYFF